MMSAKSLSLLLLSAGTASAAQIALSGAVTTFDQGSPYNIAAAINGSTTDGLGWGVFGGQTTAQTAVFTAAAPVTTGEIGFSLPWFFGSNHIGQSFRISTTTDPTPSAGGAWTPIAPNLFRASGGGVLSSGGGGLLNLTTLPSTPTTSFLVTSTGAFTGVTGFRLEMFTGGNGQLGASANGNFVLTEFQANTGNTINRALAAAVTSSAGTYPGQPATNLTDGMLNSLTHPDTGVAANFNYTVDLGGIFALTSVELYNRGDGCCPDRLTNFRVQVLDNALSSVWSADVRTNGTNSGTNGVDTITAAMGTGAFTGRFLRITNLSGADYNPQMAELRAFGTAVPEPGAAALASLAAIALGRRRKW
jgi:hypothetical protein